MRAVPAGVEWLVLDEEICRRENTFICCAERTTRSWKPKVVRNIAHLSLSAAFNIAVFRSESGQMAVRIGTRLRGAGQSLSISRNHLRDHASAHHINAGPVGAEARTRRH